MESGEGIRVKESGDGDLVGKTGDATCGRSIFVPTDGRLLEIADGVQVERNFRLAMRFLQELFWKRLIMQYMVKPTIVEI